MMLHVAVVHVGSEICHITADLSPEGLAARLGEYVRREVEHQLEPAAARRVLDLLAQGRAEEAVELYFASVGRWDPECLVRRQIELEALAG